MFHNRKLDMTVTPSPCPSLPVCILKLKNSYPPPPHLSLFHH